MVATTVTMMICAVHNYPTSTTTTTNIAPTAQVTAMVVEKQRIQSQQAGAYPFPTNVWKYIIRVAAGGVFNARSITETITVADFTPIRKVSRPKSETATISESLARKALPKIATETATVSAGSILRKAMPKVAAETISVAAGTVARFFHAFRSLSDTVTKAESLLRKPRPLIPTQTAAISDSLAARKVKGFILTETVAISELLKRKAMPKIAAQTTTIAESLARVAHFFRSLSDSVSKAESILRIAKPKIATQTTTIAESLSKIGHFFRSASDSKSISDLLKRKPMPLVATQTVNINDFTPRRKVKRFFSETTSISESLARVKRYIRTLSESVTVASGSLLRKALPKIATELISIASTISASKGGTKNFTLTETVTITDAITRNAHFYRSASDSKSITDSIKRKVSFAIREPQVANYYDPLYIYPDWWIGTPWSWTPIIQAAAANPKVKFFVVINVNSGPDTAVNGDYTQGLLQLLANPNVVALGYVGTLYGAKTLANVEAEIDSWVSFYPGSISGIMLDEMQNVTGQESYYSSITAYAHAKPLQYVFGNPGTATVSSYVGTVDTILVFENVGPPPNESTLQSLTFNHAYGKNAFGIVVHDQSSDPGQTYITMASGYVNYIHLTDGTGGSPYGIIPSYINTTASELTPAFAVLDSILRKVIRKLTDSKTVTDSIARVAHFFRKPATETTAISESLLRLVHRFRAASDSIAVSDSLSRFAHRFRTLADTVIISSSVVRAKGKFFNLVEPVAVTDSLSRLAKHFRSQSEPVILVADSLKRKALPRVLTQTTPIADSLTRTRKLVISQTVIVSEVVHRKISKRLQDAVVIFDHLSKAGRFTQYFFSESVPVSDALSIKTYIQKVVRSVGGIGGGFAGAGERRARPIPMHEYYVPGLTFVKDWTMAFRKNMTQKKSSRRVKD